VVKRRSCRSAAPWPKLTGGKGIHVVLPFQPEHSWDEVYELSRQLARRAAQRHPGLFTLHFARERRAEKCSSTTNAITEARLPLPPIPRAPVLAGLSVYPCPGASSAACAAVISVDGVELTATATKPQRGSVEGPLGDGPTPSTRMTAGKAPSR
jgi:hypothetical protein